MNETGKREKCETYDQLKTTIFNYNNIPKLASHVPKISWSTFVTNA